MDSAHLKILKMNQDNFGGEKQRPSNRYKIILTTHQFELKENTSMHQ